MAKRGRPRKTGVRDAWMLARSLIAICRYDEARSAPNSTFKSAIESAVSEVKLDLPGIPISKTEARSRRAAAERRRFCYFGVANRLRAFPHSTTSAYPVQKIWVADRIKGGPMF